jgi:hypothetical protein
MYVLILMVALNGKALSVNTVLFNGESNCLQAISKSLEMESPNVKIRARCIKQ